MRRAIFMLAFILLIGVAVPAGAQSDLAVDFFQVQLWPEYDQPSMLVIYTIELNENQPLPVEVTVRIPKSVGVPTAVAVLEDATLVTREYTRELDGDWATLTLQADFPVIQIEYYDSALNQQNQLRTYDFSLVSDFNIDSLIVSIKQPVNASGMTIQPTLGSGFADSDGRTVYASSLGPLPAGQTFDLSLSYNKSDSTLSVGGGQGSGSATQQQGIASVTSQLPPWAWALVGLGVVVLAGGAILYFRSNRSYQSQSSYKRKKQAAGSRTGRQVGSGKATGVFCHQCGTQALADDKYCRECGTKLRL
jgi:hypothetical protein